MVLTDAQRKIAAGMLEADLELQVRDLCRVLHLAVNHFPDSRRSWLPGFPDLEIIGTAILHRELKAQRGILSLDQRAVGSKIMRAGGNWAVWRPADLLDGTIERQLREIA